MRLPILHGNEIPKSLNMSAPLTHTLGIMIYLEQTNMKNVLYIRNERMHTYVNHLYQTDTYTVLANIKIVDNGKLVTRQTRMT